MMMKKHILRLLWSRTTLICLTTLTLISITSCAQDPIDLYFAKMEQLLNHPQSLVEIRFKKQYWINNDPTQIDLSFSDFLNNYQNVLEVVGLKAWNDWNTSINNNPQLNEQTKAFLQLDRKLLINPIISNYQTDVPETIDFYLNLTNGKFTNVVRRISLDLKPIKFVRQKPIENEINNNNLTLWATTLAKTYIEQKQWDFNQIKQDPSLLNFSLTPNDFDKFKDPILKQLQQPNCNFYYDPNQIISNPEIKLYLYFNDKRFDQGDVLNQIKKQSFYLITNPINLSNN